MSMQILGLTGSFTIPSRTYTLVSQITSLAAKKYGMMEKNINLSHFGESLRLAQHPGQLDEIARERVSEIIDADVLVVGVPTYQASYPGMFKHLFDMIDPHALVGKPVILAATGGSERHALMLEHQLRPLFHYFRVMSTPTGVYAASSEFEGFILSDQGLQNRIERATDELAPFITQHTFTKKSKKREVCLSHDKSSSKINLIEK